MVGAAELSERSVAELRLQGLLSAERVVSVALLAVAAQLSEVKVRLAELSVELAAAELLAAEAELAAVEAAEVWTIELESDGERSSSSISRRTENRDPRF